MNPFHFGASEKRLFGVYHPPHGKHRKACGVVLCPAARDEYFLTHRAFRLLAAQLARAGFPSLRFDYYGSGDSFGESHDGTIEQWKSDVAMAIDELKGIGGVTKVSLVGLRLGATLAALVASDRNGVADVERIVLWDPIVIGRRYLDDLRARHRAFLRDRMLEAGASADEPDGLLGFPMTDTFGAELDSIGLTNVGGYRGQRVLVVVCERAPEYADLARQLTATETEFVFQYLPGWRIWEKDVLWSRELVPTPVIRRVTTWLE